MKKALKILGGLAVVVGLILGSVYVYATNFLEYPPLKIGGQSIIYASDGKTELGRISSVGDNYVALNEDEIPELLKQAHLAAEDRGFYDHEGVSLLHTTWAAVTSAANGGIVGGGSTIDQQYVKNAYLTQDRTLERWGKGVMLAYKLDHEFGKDQILTKYLNTNFYGRGTYGVESAAQVWFGRSARDIKDPNNPLDVAQASFLASLVKKPSDYDDPVDPAHPDQLKLMGELVERQKYTLDGLRDLDGVSPIVSQGTIDEAKGLLPLKITATERLSGTASNADLYLVAYIKDWMIAWQTEIAKQAGFDEKEAGSQGKSVTDAMLARGGLQIHTTINPQLQQYVAAAVAEELPQNGLSAGVVILDPRTGGVAAMYSGHDYRRDSFNYALYAERQTGSIMKTVVLADAVRNGISVESVLPAPACITITGAEICNHNHRPGSDSCSLTVADAIKTSNNPVLIELISGQMVVGCEDTANLSPISADYPISPTTVAALARQMGADDSLVPGRTQPVTMDEVPSLALGVNSLSPLKVAAMGATLANGGEHHKPYIVERIQGDSEGVAYQHEAAPNRVLSPEQAAIVNQTLTRVFEDGGTAEDARLKDETLAGKAGSTEVDIRMLAYSAVQPDSDAPAYVCSAWAGFADSRPTKGLWGADIARICRHFFADALRDVPRIEFPGADLSSGERLNAKADPPPQPQPEPPPQPEPTSQPQPTPPAQITTLPPSTPPEESPVQTGPLSPQPSS